MADTYLSAGDARMAARVLEQGYEETGSEALWNRLEQLRQGLDVSFESRLDFVPYDSLSAEQQSVEERLISAIKAQDRAG